MKYERNVGMKVFSKLYVGFKHQIVSSDGYDHRTHAYKNPVYGVPLGFATPYEDNAAGRKRQSTVDSWAKGYGKTLDKPAEIIDNELAAGFKVTDDIKRVYWGGGNVVFRIEDPRGFELEIQAQNLMTLLRQVGVMQGGEIPGKCIWGRDGANNVLIHETSEEYENARLAAETIKPLKGAAKNAFKPGDIVILTNGEEVRYLGRFWFTKYEHDTDENYEPFLPVQFVSNKALLGRFPTHSSCYRLSEPVQYYAVTTGGAQVTIYRDIKVASVKEEATTEWAPKSSLNLINKAEITTASSSGSGTFISASESKTPMEWTQRPLNYAELNAVIKGKHGEMKRLYAYGGWRAKRPIIFAAADELGRTWNFSGYDSWQVRSILHGDSWSSNAKAQPDMFYGNLIRVKSNELVDTHINTYRNGRSAAPTPRGDQITMPVHDIMKSNDEGVGMLKAMHADGRLFTFEATYKEETQ